MLRDEVDDAVELIHDHLADDQAEADALSVDLPLLVFERGEQLEEVLLVLLLDPHAGIDDRDPEVLAVFGLLDLLDDDQDLPALRREL